MLRVSDKQVTRKHECNLKVRVAAVRVICYSAETASQLNDERKEATYHVECDQKKTTNHDHRYELLVCRTNGVVKTRWVVLRRIRTQKVSVFVLMMACSEVRAAVQRDCVLRLFMLTVVVRTVLSKVHVLPHDSSARTW